MDTRSTWSRLKRRINRHSVATIVSCAVVLLTFGLMTGVTMFTNKVLIIDGSFSKSVLTTSDEVEQILADNNFTVENDDKVLTEEADGKLKAIHILRAFNVTVTADGKDHALKMYEGTVEDAIAEAGIYVNEEDLLNIGLKEPLRDGMNIRIRRVVYESEVKYTDIPFTVKEIENANYKKGTTHVETEGVLGQNLQSIKNTYIDGELVSTDVMKEEVIKKPVQAVVSVGTNIAEPISKAAPLDFKVDENGIPTKYKKVYSGKATAYSAKPGAKTASGRYAVVGTVAVNPNIIPYGSKVYIVSQDGRHVYGYAIAADTGTGMMDGSILVDVFCKDYKSSCRWGLKYVDLYVLE